MTVDIVLELRQVKVAGKQDTGSEFQSMAVRGKKLDEYRQVQVYMYLLWEQIQWDVNEQRNVWCGQRYSYIQVEQPVKVLWSIYRYNICKRGSMGLQSNEEIHVHVGRARP